MADSLDYLMGKISGQLEGLDGRMDDLKESIGQVGARQQDLEERVGTLERRESHSAGVLATIAAVASLVGGSLVNWLSRKF